LHQKARFADVLFIFLQNVALNQKVRSQFSWRRADCAKGCEYDGGCSAGEQRSEISQRPVLVALVGERGIGFSFQLAIIRHQ